MNIGQIKEELKKADPTHSVYFSFACCAPTTVNSWRGIYAEPAIGWAPTGYSGTADAPTVSVLLKELEDATDGREYTGWKGGEYRYRDSHPLHVDNPGDSTYTKIERVELKAWCVVLHTVNEE